MKVIKLLICFISFCFFLPTSYCQTYYNINAPARNGQSKDFIPASPAAASLGLFGQIPVGNYTGTASIGVPLYNISYKDLTVAIGINYHAAGNKPDLFPGIVGMGWALSAGGSVTRVVKGMPDYESYEIGAGPIPALYNPTGEPDWSTTTNLTDRLADGGFYADQDRTNPDEFYFSFNGSAGKFYMNQLESFRVKSSGDEFFTVEAEVLQHKSFTMPLLTQDPSVPWSHPYENVHTQDQLIYKITITDDHGIKYIFGGTDQSIEFSRPGHSYDSHNNATMWRLVTPMTWHLTSIVSPNGYSITFNYERGIIVTKVGFCDITRSIWNKQGSSSPTTTVVPAPMALGEKSTLINASYLSSIVTPKETLNFTFSDAVNQLQQPTDPYLYAPNAVNENMFYWYTDIGRALTESMRSKKLDRIEVRDAGNVLHKNIVFDYTTSSTTRLKLQGVSIHGNDFQIGALYSFEYDPQPLPPYLSYKTDHYGYYNGRNPYINTTNAAYYLNTLNQQQFFDSKEPDPAYVQAEILKKITYPTGGYTEFEYEPNMYGTQVQTWPFTTVAAGSNKITGGVRIKKITSYASAGVQASSKRYFYVKNYLTGGTASSGVLAFQPTYYENLSGTVVPPSRYAGSPQYYNGTITLTHWSSNPIYPLGETRGNHVTYSEVTEVNEDGSAIVYKYKNHDNGYNDREPINKVSDNANIKEFWKEDEGISMDLERGQLLSEELYDASGAIKKRKELAYNDDPARFDNNVRVISQTFNSLKKADIASFRLTASLIYTYFPFLKRITETAYETGNQPTLTTIINYEFDEDFRLITKVESTTSDQRQITVINRYPKDMVTAGITMPYQAMVDSGMVGLLVSSEQLSDGVKQTKNITEFAGGLSGNASQVLPQYVKTQYRNRPEEIRQNYHQYDVKGNIVSSSVPDGLKTCYIWSYNYTYPVAKIENAEYATVIAALGGQQAINDFAASIPADNDLATFLAPLRSNVGLSGAMVHTYTYNILTGMTSETSPNNRSTYYEYDYMGRLNIVRDHDHNILKKICYNYAGQVENCGAGPGYDVTQFVYAPLAGTICTSGSLLQVIMAYSKKRDPENPILILYPEEFFWDSEFISHPPDGYYKVTNSAVMSAGNTIYHMVNGKIQGIHICP